VYYRLTKDKRIEYNGYDAIWGQIIGAVIGVGGSYASQKSSLAGQREIAQMQIAASQQQLEMSLAANAALVEAQIGAQYDIFYKQQAAQYDIFNKQQEGAYEIYNAQQRAAYNMLVQQFEFQKTADLSTARSGVRIAKIQAGALKASAEKQMDANIKSTKVMMEAGLAAAELEAAGIRQGAQVTFDQDIRNVGLMWMEAEENMRRTRNQHIANEARTRAIIGATGGAFVEGTSQAVYYRALEAEQYAQFNWMQTAYTSQKDALTTTAEENYNFALENAGRLLETAKIENQALWDSTQIQNQALWEKAVIEGQAAIDVANDTLRTMEEIYSRNYFTPPEVLTYEPISPPSGGGGGGHGGYGGHGHGGGGGGGGRPAYTNKYYEIYRQGGGKKFTVEAQYIDYYTESRGYVIGGYYGTNQQGQTVRLKMDPALANRQTSSGTNQGYSGYNAGFGGGGAGGYESPGDNW
jgi:hypothetical protein